MNEIVRSIAITLGCLSVPSVIQYISNIKRKKRSRQTIIPLVEPVYFATAVFYVLNFYKDILEFLPFVDMNSSLEKKFGTVSLILNLVIFSGYLVFKSLLVLICKLLFSKKPITIITKEFYEYDEDYQEWFLKDSCTTLRSLFFWVSVASLIMSSILLGLMIYFGPESKISTIVFPVFVIMTCLEIFCYLNGYTKTEYIRAVDGDDARFQKISNFYRIRETYEKIFPRNILAASTSFEYAVLKGTVDKIKELKKSEDPRKLIAAEFFEINSTDEAYNADCIEAVTKLLKGENVIFFNPFYKDLGRYLVLAFMDTLLAGKNCLIMVGRSSTQSEITKWIEDLLAEYGKIKSLWRVKALSSKDPKCEVGVLNFSQLYDLKVIEANREFLKNTGFVFMSEPSLILNTGQIGLSILAGQMNNDGEKPVYCISDRISDGLVDTISHLLHAEFMDVVAPPIPKSVSTSIAWNANGDYLRQKIFGKQTQYLGNGTELAAVAVRNQIPKVSWFSSRKIPIRDVKWMVGQYFPVICKYMNVPNQQQGIYDRIDFSDDLWGAEEHDEEFVIAEDEFNNFFGMIRMFLSRGKNQSFVNVLSENYLLRDYMRCNPQIFMTNPGAVPSLVPDYAKSERNILIRLLLEMTYRKVSESEIFEQLALGGVETDDAYAMLTELLGRYTDAKNDVFEIENREGAFEGLFGSKGTYYRINDVKFDEYFGDSLKTAYFVCEDETQETEYIDAMLTGLTTQLLLPGQYVTYNGKYYFVKSITSRNGVVLRRASKAFNGRRYYRQLRRYSINPDTFEIVGNRRVMDVEITRFAADISVDTTGYLEMSDNADLRTSRLYDISADPQVGKYSRKYRHKNALMIDLPGSDEKIRFTLCMILSELIKSVLPDGWQYVAITSSKPDGVDGYLNYLLYELDDSLEKGKIYVFEDSEIDLGLIDVIERNVIQLIEMVTDYLAWHFEKMREPEKKDPEIHTVDFPPENTDKKKKSAGLFKRISMLSAAKKAKDIKIKSVEEVENEKTDVKAEASEEEAVSENENINETVAESVNEVSGDGAEVKDNTVINEAQNGHYDEQSEDEDWNPDDNEDPDYVAIDGTDIFDNSYDDGELLFKDLFDQLNIPPIKKTRYQNECFLKFGFEEIDERLELEEVKQYLTARGFFNSSFTKARTRDSFADEEEFDLSAEAFCDFCGLPLNGVSYERLDDGRIRCGACSATAIDSVEEFKALFSQTIQIVESLFKIDYKVPISARMTDSKHVKRGKKQVYKPKTVGPRKTVGYAERNGDSFCILIENGSPRLATIRTIVSGLTFIWQFKNWDERKINKLYETEWKRDLVYLGMTEWASVQYLYMIGEDSYAQQQERILEYEDSAYAEGFRMFRTKYPLVKDFSLITASPFSHFPPI